MATASSEPLYENLIVDDAISAEPVELSSIPEYSAIILLLGPTGSGKSSFLQSIASETPSATSLRGESSRVMAYRLQGVRAKLWNGLDVYIVATPGFNDNRISELEIVTMVQDWTADLNDRIMAFHVLFFHPITDVRVSGSKMQLFRMLRAMRTDESQHSTTLITTMWDRISESGMEHAERRFQRLKSQNPVSINSSILRFENTSASAMSVLNTVLIGTADGFTGLRSQSREAEALQMLTKAALADRIHTLQTTLEGVEKELGSKEVQGDHALEQVYLSQKAHITTKLEMFRMEENEFYQPIEDLSTNINAKEPPPKQGTRLKSPIALHTSLGPLGNVCVPISIRRVRREDIAPYSNLFVLMGPTGTGKSSFIQALSLGGPLGIVGGGLDSVTKNVSAYELVGIKSQWASTSIYLLDTPGFADPNMSESRILNQLQSWAETMHCSNTGVILRVIYFHDIRDNRVPGTRQQCLEIFKAFCGEGTGYRLALVTAMWDMLFKPDQLKKAELQLENLREVHWKDWISRGSQIMRFRNNFDSAIKILDTMLAGANNATGLQPMSGDNLNEYVRIAFQRLIDRIHSYKSQLLMFDDDLASANVMVDEELVTILLQQRGLAERALERFTQKYDDFVKEHPGILELFQMPSQHYPMTSVDEQPPIVDNSANKEDENASCPQPLSISKPSAQDETLSAGSSSKSLHRKPNIPNTLHWPWWPKKNGNGNDRSRPR